MFLKLETVHVIWVSLTCLKLSFCALVYLQTLLFFLSVIDLFLVNANLGWGTILLVALVNHDFS